MPFRHADSKSSCIKRCARECRISEKFSSRHRLGKSVSGKKYYQEIKGFSGKGKETLKGVEGGEEIYTVTWHRLCRHACVAMALQQLLIKTIFTDFAVYGPPAYSKKRRGFRLVPLGFLKRVEDRTACFRTVISGKILLSPGT